MTYPGTMDSAIPKPDICSGLIICLVLPPRKLQPKYRITNDALQYHGIVSDSHG